MKKYLLVSLLLSVIGLSSCLKENDTFKDPFVQLAEDEVVIKKYIADNNIPAIRDTSGVYYQIITPGVGEHKYVPSTEITVLYTGKFLGGSTFDTSGSTPRKFVLRSNTGSVIAGWQIGIQYIQKGGKIRLIIPSGYAYGAQEREGIPANSILDFDIELVDVK